MKTVNFFVVSMTKFILGGIVVAALVGWYLMRSNPQVAEEMLDKGIDHMDTSQKEIREEGGQLMDKTRAGINQASVETAKRTKAPVKEFTLTAYYDDRGVWFSLKEMRVQKGDLVRINVTNTKGMHDFSLDEFGIKEELPLNKTVQIELVADKAGSFTYYCSKPGHRAKGQWGTLIVE